MTSVNWHSARRVLAIRLDSLGDVVMTTPALRALKESLPSRHLALLTSRSGALAAELLPFVDDVRTYEPPWMKSSPLRADASYDDATIAWLRRQRFDAAVIFTVFSQSPLPAALLCHLGEIPLRAAHCRENPYHLLTHWIAETEPEQQIRHEVRRQLDLVAALGCRTTDERLTVVPRPADHARALHLLVDLRLASKRNWVVVHPGATAAARRYPAGHYAAVVQELAARGLKLIFTGDAAEVPLVESIRARALASTVSLAGELSLGELTALIASAPLLLTNNTGPAHLAAAVGTPVVDLYALTNPQHTPWQVPQRVLNHDVPCKYCYKSVCPLEHHACLVQVSPQTVVEAVCDLLRETHRSCVETARSLPASA